MEGRGTPTTMVLVGKTGNGKSATGNSILGRRAFKSKTSSSPVTGNCELQQVQMKDGRILNVIDTPGLFDPNVKLEFLGPEIVKCIDLAKEGLHGVLLVLSVKNRFTTEEASALHTLQRLFGEKIVNYMVVIFTGGDDLEANGETLEDYLVEDYLRDSSSALQEWSTRRKNIESGGYSKEQLQILLEKMEKAHAEQFKKLTETVEERLRIATNTFEQQLAAEKSAREWAERNRPYITCGGMRPHAPSPPPRLPICWPL